MHPERNYSEQWARIERLLALAEAKNELEAFPGLEFYDLIVIAIQALWNLKDWILNDPAFGAKDIRALRHDIFASEVLRVCSDLANGTKHFRLDAPKTSVGISERAGIHVEQSKGIFQHFYYLVSEDHNGPYNGMEAREFLQTCRYTWQTIIEKHHLSNVDAYLFSDMTEENG